MAHIYTSLRDVTGQDVVILNLDCFSAAPHSLETYHLIGVRERLAPTGSLPSVPSGFDERGPAWLREGVIRYMRHWYRVERRYEDADASRNRESSGAGQTTRLLSASSTSAGFHEEYGPSGSLAFLALEWLAERAGQAAIFTYYRLLPESETWEEAFEGAFGIAVDDFYEQFEAHRAEVAPPFPHLTDTSDEPVLEFLGDPPAETRVAIRAEVEAVRNYFALELEAGTADYTLYVGTDQESLVDTYVRVSGTQPPSRVCSWLPYSGSAIINPDCHAAPHRLDEVHFIAVRELLAPWLSLPPVPDGFDRRGPLWLRYGAELYIGAVYRAARGYEELQTSWDRRSSRARQTARLLESMSTWEGIRANNDFSRGTALGSLAVEWLADRAGDPAIFEYYRLLPDSETWEEAFEGAFGIAVDDFYEQFEAYRAEVAPPNEDADAS